jgi:hypothetical protein
MSELIRIVRDEHRKETHYYAVAGDDERMAIVRDGDDMVQLDTCTVTVAEIVALAEALSDAHKATCFAGEV